MLEEQAKEQAKAEDGKAAGKGKRVTEDGGDCDDRIYYSIYANLCSDPELVRKYLDSGVLTRMIARYEAKMLANSEKRNGYHHDGYKFILLGACAMSLGCHLPESYKAMMKKHFQSVGLMRDALTQMNKALNGPNGYKDGEPYEFGSLGLHDTMAMGGPPEADLIFPNMMNVEAPGGMHDVFLQGVAISKAIRDAHPMNVCGGCGAKKGGDAAALLTCSKCQERKYCTRECQKWHWKVHKTACRVPREGKENLKR